MAMRGDFPFIRILRSIPSEMRDKLPSEFVSILETRVWLFSIHWECLLTGAGQKLVKPEQLHTAVQDMVLFYHRKFDMVFPPLNWPLILFQYIKRLALPGMREKSIFSKHSNKLQLKSTRQLKIYSNLLISILLSLQKWQNYNYIVLQKRNSSPS